MCYGQVGNRRIPLYVHENTFIHDFSNTFGDKLPFSISDKFDRVPIERTTLKKKEIKGELTNSTSKMGYYKADPTSITYDEEDSSYLNAEVANNLYLLNKQEHDETRSIQQLEIQSLLTEGFNSIKDLSSQSTSYVRSSILGTSSSTIVNDHQIHVIRDKIESSKPSDNNKTTKVEGSHKALYMALSSIGR